MADRPIIFSAPMIAALLAGRKTQTRRILKPQPDPRIRQVMILGNKWFGEGQGDRGLVFQWGGAEQVMRFAVGDRLWVKEAWRIDGAGSRVPAEACLRHGRPVEYRADGYEPTAWMERSPIFMPRRASRLTLLVTDVRIERLQDISEGDAIDEGALTFDLPTHGAPTERGQPPLGQPPSQRFRHLWNSINGPEAWAANPWVVAVTFSVHAHNIDQLAPIAEAAE